MSSDSHSLPQIATFRISPLISGSLAGLFAVLTAPLPLLMRQQHQEQLLPFSAMMILIGGVLIWGLLSQRVCVDSQGIRIEYAAWVPQWLGQCWSLDWHELASLKSRPTSQGGQAHYFVTHSGQAYLFPMRIAGFAQFLRLVEAHSNCQTSHIKPLAQPWMYFMLGLCVLLMGIIDIPIMIQAWTTPH